MILKKFLIKTLFVFELFVDLFVFKLVCLIKLSKWCRIHPPPQDFRNYFQTTNIDRYDLYHYILSKESLKLKQIDYLEFGVYKGASIKWWSENLKNSRCRFFGFDTFTGLPQKYRDLSKGHFSTNSKVPKINDDRIEYKIGFFKDTLLPFLSKISLKNMTILHLDADLYSSTLFVLCNIIPILPKGSIIIFDEFSGSCGQHEFRAFNDFLSSYNINYQLLGTDNNYLHVAFKII